MNMQEHIELDQGMFGVCSSLSKGMELYVPSGFITSYCHVRK